MNSELELRIQACLDSELSASEAQEVMDLVRRDAEAGALFETLSETRKLVSASELDRVVPASREFYWSKIEREIIRHEKQPDEFVLPWRKWLLRLAFAGGAAALAISVTVPRFKVTERAANDYAYYQEIESPSEDVSAITFHSNSANMTVVWVQTQTFDTN